MIGSTRTPRARRAAHRRQAAQAALSADDPAIVAEVERVAAAPLHDDLAIRWDVWIEMTLGDSPQCKKDGECDLRSFVSPGLLDRTHARS